MNERTREAMIPTYFGEAVQWECDELGHLNMRHYMTKASQARQMFFITLGLDYAFRAGADSTVRTSRFMVRYLKESRPGARLQIRTGLMALHDSTAEIVHIMTHFDGTISAVITETVDHIYLRTGERFAWPRRVCEAADKYKVPRPASAMPRGLRPDITPLAPCQSTLQKHGATPIGMGVFQPAETDIFQAVTPQALLGRITESVGNFEALWPEIHEARATGGSLSAALLEIAVYIHDTPTSGEPCALFSAVQEANRYTRRAAHHIVHPITGQSWASVDASACLFDLTTRKLVKTPPQDVARLNNIAIADVRA